MPAKPPTRPVAAWIEYIERYLPLDAEQLRQLQEPDPTVLSERVGRRAIRQAVARLTDAAPAED